MKRYLSVLLALILALTLTACAAYAIAGTPEAKSTLETSGSDVSAPPEDVSLPDVSQPEEDHSHQTAEADNIVPHEQMLYCGNTVTKISAEAWANDGDWEASFWGDDSIALTDLLIHLDYSGDICRCLPEYSVTTEFDEEPYGVNLTEGYARHEDSQVDLTQEQIDLIRDILERNRPD